MTLFDDTRRDAVVRLVETVTVLPGNDGLRLLHDVDVLRVRGPAAALRTAVGRLRRGLAASELDALPPHSVLRRLATRLYAAGWITAADPSHGKDTAVERQIGYLTLFGSDAPGMQSRIGASRVAVLGVGGVGGIVAQHLVGAGVGALWLVDHDRVAVHNLNRQFLSGWRDIGSHKTDVAETALRALAPEAELHSVRCLVTGPGDLDRLPGDLDLLVMAADTPSDIALVVWDWAAARGVAVCEAAVGLGTGYWGPLLVPELGHCAHCFEAARLARLSDEDGQAALDGGSPTPYSFGPANTAVSALLAHEVLRYLATGHCSVLNRRGHIRFSEGTTSFLEGAVCTCTAAEPKQPAGPEATQAEFAWTPSER